MSKSRDKHKEKYEKEIDKVIEKGTKKIAKTVHKVVKEREELLERIEQNSTILNKAVTKYPDKKFDKLISSVEVVYTKLVQQFKTEEELNKLNYFINSMLQLPTLTEKSLAGVKGFSSMIKSIVNEDELRSADKALVDILNTMSKLLQIAEQQKLDINNLPTDWPKLKEEHSKLNSSTVDVIKINQDMANQSHKAAQFMLQLVDNIKACLAKPVSKESAYSTGAGSTFSGAATQRPHAYQHTAIAGGPDLSKKK